MTRPGVHLRHKQTPKILLLVLDAGYWTWMVPSYSPAVTMQLVPDCSQ